jgi:hypothetical protein
VVQPTLEEAPPQAGRPISLLWTGLNCIANTSSKLSRILDWLPHPLVGGPDVFVCLSVGRRSPPPVIFARVGSCRISFELARPSLPCVDHQLARLFYVLETDLLHPLIFLEARDHRRCCRHRLRHRRICPCDLQTLLREGKGAAPGSH